MGLDKYLVLKMSGAGTKTTKSVVVTKMGQKQTIFVTGNLPELYQGMYIRLYLDENNFALDYDVSLGDGEENNNTRALKKAKINVDEYRAILERHQILKRDGIGWNTARLSLDEIYKILPFGEADKVHKEMLNDAYEPHRIEAINQHIIDKARTRRKIEYGIGDFLNLFDRIEQDGSYDAVTVTTKVNCLLSEKYGLENGVLFDVEMREKEEYINDNIDKRLSLEYKLLTVKEIQSFIDTLQNKELAEEQINTLWCLKNSIPCIITGGAGVGKTTVIKTLIDCYAMHYNVGNVLLIAPTGKASRRLAEKTKLPAMTIHRALRKTPEDDYTVYNERNPLPHRLIIVDESSMIDTSLMYDLLSAVDPTSKIIFVGDHNQLYPVGYGEPFVRFMDKLDVFKLVINHRQAEGTDILKNANAVLENKPIKSGAGVTIKTISYMDIGQYIATNDKNTQIITPYNSLNEQINEFLRTGKDMFNVGDKVMTIRNTKEYCNGDIGYITKIDGKGTIHVKIEDKTVKITTAHYEDLTLAYSITVHKMQGSEASRVMIFIPIGDNLIEKRLIYTAITRARNVLELYYFTPN